VLGGQPFGDESSGTLDERTEPPESVKEPDGEVAERIGDHVVVLDYLLATELKLETRGRFLFRY